jgi:ABC-type multidrug transport system fused ATPase/permease subunit
MLALRWTGSTISLGTVRLYQSVAQQLTSTLSHLTMVLERAYQTIFYLAAYIEATTNLDATDMAARPWTGTSKATLTDYEAIRNEGGLSIRARNVNYTYPTADKPALHNINIDIRAGETLAIVGYNGGGKSTLVKVLMGLYDHDGNDGDLLINGVPLRQIDHVSLHRRTSCLFQNFNKYPLSLRENIGVGSFQHMADGDLIKRAVARGGADAVVNKVGLERKLLPAEVTDPDDMVPETPVNAAAVGGDLQPMEARDAPVTVSDAIKPENGTLSKANAAEVDFSAQTLEVEPSAGNRSSGQSPVLRFGNSDPKNGVHPTPKGGKGSVGPAKDDKRIGLSGGQWQRIALARAFLRSDEADLVIFE